MIAAALIGILIFSLGMILGGFIGWGAGKERTKSLLNPLVIEINCLREFNKSKRDKRIMQMFAGDKSEEGDKLDVEIQAELSVLNPIQRIIDGWIRVENESSICTQMRKV